MPTRKIPVNRPPKRPALYGFQPDEFLEKTGAWGKVALGPQKAQEAFNLTALLRGRMRGDLDTLLEGLRGSPGYGGLEQFRGDIGAYKAQGLAATDQLRQSLIGGALGTSSGAQVAAAQAARSAAGGRGGLAFGGGAGALAGLAGQQAATQQSGLLSQALGQATQARLGVLGQTLGAQGEATKLGLGLSGLEAGLANNYLGQQGGFMAQIIAAMLGGEVQRNNNLLSNGGFSSITGGLKDIGDTVGGLANL